MHDILDIMNDFCKVLIQVERNGIKIDIDALDALEKEYTEEYNNLENKLDSLVREAMGDTPFKLSSNDDLSMIVYSRKPYCKESWAKTFNLGGTVVNGVRKPKRPAKMCKDELEKNILDKAHLIYKTKASQCENCKGRGKVRRLLKSGNYSDKPSRCKVCNGAGVIYTSTGKIAGFKQAPSSVKDLAVHGYKCSKDKLQDLAKEAEGDAKEFLTAMVRFNAITHYLSAFIEGIRKNTGGDGILHSQFNQCTTATGRLSSRNPNFHNQPRGGTFPIRRVIVSRWNNGSITEADYAQLEFRVAASLAKDDTAINDIIDGRDVHQYTADVLTKNGQKTSRQDAKTHTFKPLYGGTSGTKAEKAYYKKFLNRYIDIKEWHDKLIDLACTHKKLILPTGREYHFPWAFRNSFGMAEGATKIKNYPVQGFATADIVPMATVALAKLYTENKLKSLIINEVHDSIVTDTYPGEEELVADLKVKAMTGVVEELEDRFGYKFLVPLKVEVKNGTNWLNMEVVKEGESQIMA